MNIFILVPSLHGTLFRLRYVLEENRPAHKERAPAQSVESVVPTRADLVGRRTGVTCAAREDRCDGSFKI